MCGVREKRSDGKLPAHVITYLTLVLALFPDDDYTEVATKVTGSLDRWGCWNAAWTVPTASAITQARKRLGRNVFPELFERTCGPVAGDGSPVAGLALGTARGSFLRSAFSRTASSTTTLVSERSISWSNSSAVMSSP